MGLQASFVGYMVSSFFLSVAFDWHIYYLVGYAIALRRLYYLRAQNEQEVNSLPAAEGRDITKRGLRDRATGIVSVYGKRGRAGAVAS